MELMELKASLENFVKCRYDMTK